MNSVKNMGNSIQNLSTILLLDSNGIFPMKSIELYINRKQDDKPILDFDDQLINFLLFIEG